MIMAELDFASVVLSWYDVKLVTMPWSGRLSLVGRRPRHASVGSGRNLSSCRNASVSWVLGRVWMICGVHGRRHTRAAAAVAVAAALAGPLAACSVASVSASGGATSAPGATAASGAATAASHGATTPPHSGSTRSPTGAPSASATAPSRPLAGKVIVLDPGHNGENWSHPAVINRPVNVITETKPCDTTGTATLAGYSEHAFTFNVAMRLARLLRAEGAKVILTRANDHGVGPCITQRAAIGNRARADAAISIHADGGPPGGSGFDVIEPGLIAGHNDAIIGPSHRLALAVRGAYHRITYEPYANYVGNHGLDVRTDLGGLNLSTVPKVFIECGNMRNAGDAAKLSSAAFRQRIAAALAAGFTAFLTSVGGASIPGAPG